MGLKAEAHARWSSHYEAQVRELLDGKGGEQWGETLRRKMFPTFKSFGLRDDAHLRIRDPDWFGHVVAVGVDEDEETFVFVFDHRHDGTLESPLWHVVGACRKCGQDVVLDPPFTDAVSLYEALEFGEPARHRCLGPVRIVGA